jgi:hypothetical protein
VVIRHFVIEAKNVVKVEGDKSWPIVDYKHFPCLKGKTSKAILAHIAIEAQGREQHSETLMKEKILVLLVVRVRGRRV